MFSCYFKLESIGVIWKKALEKPKEVSRFAMAEEYNCKPHELDEIIEREHSIMQKLRTSGLFDEEILEMVGNKTVDATDSDNAETTKQTSFFDVEKIFKVAIMSALYGKKRVKGKKRCPHSKSIEIEKLSRNFAMNKTENTVNEKVIMIDNGTSE